MEKSIPMHYMHVKTEVLSLVYLLNATFWMASPKMINYRFSKTFNIFMF